MTPQACAKDTVFISYAHESPAFREDVKALADWLAENGIMVVSDHRHEILPPAVGWPTWMQQEIEDAAVVLTVCSPLYKARFEKRAEPDKGKGVTWEGAIITQDIYNAAVRNKKFFPILPDGGRIEDVPKVLQAFHNDHRFPSKNAGVLALIRQVLADRAAAVSTVGPVPFAPVPAASATTLPPVWNVPHGRNPNFTGREELLTQLKQGLASGRAAALTQALAGLGGVGKTQTAVEYAWRHKTDYQIVWWLRSEQATTLAADFAALAKPLNLPEQDAQDQAVIIDAVRRWLGHHPGWLLIFDNAVDKKDITPYLPQGAAGHVLITSRSQVWQGVAASLSVKAWERAESVAFLEQFKTAKDPAGADAVAHALGDLPLALAQAAAYMDETVTSYADYLNLFNTRRDALWGQQPPPDSYPDTVGTTWTLSMEAAAQPAPGAAELMRLCAWLAPDDIPRDMLRDGSKHVPEPLRSVLEDPLEMGKVVAALRRYSLLEVRDDAFDMHRLVQAVVEDRLDAEARKTWCAAAARVVNKAYPFDSDNVTTWHECARLTPHARIVASHAEAMCIAPDAAGRLLNQVAGYLRERAEFREAKNLYDRSIKIDEGVYGPDHPKVATPVCNLGGVLKALGDMAGARVCYERALKIDKAVYGNNSPEVAISVNNLGGVLRSLGDLAGARTCYEQALSMDEATYGPDSLNMAIYVSNLAGVLHDLGNLAEARECYERVLSIFEATYGPVHPKVAVLSNNLGSVLRDLGDLVGARACHRRALRIDEAAYGPEHPSVARDLSNLGLVLRDLGDVAKARACIERALRIDEAVYGKEHPEVAMFVCSLGSLLQDLGDLAGARACFEQALAIRRKVFGRSHPDTRLVAKNLTELAKMKKRRR